MFYDLILKVQKTRLDLTCSSRPSITSTRYARQVQSACSDNGESNFFGGKAVLKHLNLHDDEFNRCSNVCLKFSHVSGNVGAPA